MCNVGNCMAVKFLPSILFGMFSICSLSSAFAAIDPLVGTWKTIDDRTGYSLADVVIRKDKHDLYSATIIQSRSVPGTANVSTCTQCTGAQKNKPMVGLTTLSGLSADPEKPNEFVGGVMLDPKSGKHYNARARLMNNGKHLIINGRTEGSAIGRNVTWVKN